MLCYKSGKLIMIAASYKGGKSMMIRLIIIMKIRFVCSKKIRLVGHILDHMLDYIRDHMLDYIIIGLVTTALQFIHKTNLSFCIYVKRPT